MIRSRQIAHSARDLVLHVLHADKENANGLLLLQILVDVAAVADI